MYLDYVVDMPDVKGKITFRTNSKARYVLMVSRLIDFFLKDIMDYATIRKES